MEKKNACSFADSEKCASPYVSHYSSKEATEGNVHLIKSYVS